LQGFHINSHKIGEDKPAYIICKRRCKIPHYRRDKIPHPITLMHVLEGCGNVNDGGIFIDPRSLQSRTEHQSDRPENWV
jgi:hypothetical protein